MAISEFRVGETPSRANFNERILEANAELEKKQNKIPGENGQIVGFDDEGNLVAQSVPGVISFNGRSGAVTPQTGDYTASQVGAIPITMAETFAQKSDITGVYIYRGSVAAYDDLPSEDQTVGDVYNVEENDMNYGWTGTVWDPLGQIFQIDYLTADEINEIMGG